jgi:hypothetical protein
MGTDPKTMWKGKHSLGRFATGTVRDVTHRLSRRGTGTVVPQNALDGRMQSLLCTTGCPVCNERRDSERVHFFWLLSENCQQPDILEDISAGLGFCSAHAMFLINRAEYTESLAHIYRWVIQNSLRKLTEVSRKPGEPYFTAPKNCYTCRTLDEEIAHSSFRRMLKSNEVWRFYGQPGLLCGEHLMTAVQAGPPFRTGLLFEVHRSHLLFARAALESCSMPDGNSESIIRALHLTIGQEPHLVQAPSAGSAEELAESDGVMTRIRAAIRGSRGCPICFEIHRARREWYEWIDARARTDEHLDDLLPSCAFHSWELVRTCSPATAKSVAVNLCEQLIDDLCRAMTALSIETKRKTWLERLVQTSSRIRNRPRPIHFRSRSCPVCYRQAVAEERTILLLMTLLGDRAAQSDYEYGSGLCVRHLASALHRREGNVHSEFLISAEQTKLSLLAWEIDERQRKSAYQWRPEALGPEETAWRRAVEKVSGSCDAAVANLGNNNCRKD